MKECGRRGRACKVRKKMYCVNCSAALPHLPNIRPAYPSRPPPPLSPPPKTTCRKALMLETAGPLVTKKVEGPGEGGTR